MVLFITYIHTYCNRVKTSPGSIVDKSYLSLSYNSSTVKCCIGGKCDFSMVAEPPTSYLSLSVIMQNDNSKRKRWQEKKKEMFAEGLFI